MDENKFVRREVAGETILLNLESGSYFTLNESGGKVLLMTLEGKTEDDIVSALCQDFEGANSSVVTCDVRELLSDLKHKKILEDADR